ncbi:putative RNA-directed DNA polymerase [Rosa chinensis]|uniref:Putative RNA-directed DNA polymerase n=1 Tax=Rosa chinensis TaxID=74649 RepID=A0A2P6RY54_ROSCH|nr:putative RNA-directed DNA polymerase [Rosa chinensis]
MASSSVSHFKVEQFDGKGNFTLWQRRVKDILVQQGLAKPLKGKDAKPVKMSDEDWEELESRCVSTIRLYIADNIINNVNNVDSATQLWEKMEKLHLGKGLQTKLNLKRDLYKLKMGEGASLMEHMNVFRGLVDQLAKVDVKIEEEDQALLLLTSLPDSYENIITTILYGKDTLKMEEVESTLLNHEKRRKADDSQISVFVAQDQNRWGRSTARGSSGHSRSKSRGRGKGKQCYKCKEWGHIRPDCPLWKEKDDKGSDCSMTGIAQASNDFGEFLTVSKGNYTCSQRDWILDTGSSHHLCSRREYFDTFQEVKGFVTWGDGTRRCVMGVGTVKIKMFDGAVRTLGDVVYVPRFRRNLVSLSQLDSKGCRVSSAGGAMKISRGCMVLMKGEKCGSMFRLIGKTQTSKVEGKRCARGCRYLKRVSFASIAETPVTSFQVSDDGERVNPAREGVKSRSLFRANR